MKRVWGKYNFSIFWRIAPSNFEKSNDFGPLAGRNWQPVDNYGDFSKFFSRGLACAFALILVSCGSTPSLDQLSEKFKQMQTANVAARASAVIPKDKVNTAPRKKAAEGIKALERNDYKAASASFNQALKMDIQNSYIHFLAGLSYHLLAVNGDASKFALAEQGYQLAEQFDKSNSLAPFYHGLLLMDQRKWVQAQELFARAALINPNDPELLYQLAAASYYAGDPASAAPALERALGLGVSNKDRPRLLRAASLTQAALDKPDSAKQYFNTYLQLAGGDNQANYLQSRINRWKEFYSTVAAEAWQGNIVKGNKSADTPQKHAQFIEPDKPTKPAAPPIKRAAPTRTDRSPLPPDEKSEFADTEMVVVDVVLIGTQDDNTYSRGINMLSGLQLQFGNPLGTNPASFSWSKEKVSDLVTRPNTTNFHTVVRAIQIPGITYSLNIANSDTSHNEILASPSLTALVGETSEFFSGVDVNAAAVSGAAGDSVSIEKLIGVKLQVTPELLPDDMIKLKVVAERTFLTQPSQSVVFQFRLDTTKTSVNANVAMRFGQTLILSGLLERATEDARDSVPRVGDIPVVDLFFSNKTKREFKKSILILLTPRRPQYKYGDMYEEDLYEDGLPRGKGLKDYDRYDGAIGRMSRRYRNWFSPEPNFAVISQYIQANELYYEFRTGDFLLERWEHSRHHWRRVKSTARYLYY